MRTYAILRIGHLAGLCPEDAILTARPPGHAFTGGGITTDEGTIAGCLN